MLTSQEFLKHLAQLNLFPPVVKLHATEINKHLNDAQRSVLMDLLRQQHEKFENHHAKVKHLEETAVAELNKLKKAYLKRQESADRQKMEELEQSIRN